MTHVGSESKHSPCFGILIDVAICFSDNYICISVKNDLKTLIASETFLCSRNCIQHISIPHIKGHIFPHRCSCTMNLESRLVLSCRFAIIVNCLCNSNIGDNRLIVRNRITGFRIRKLKFIMPSVFTPDKWYLIVDTLSTNSMFATDKFTRLYAPWAVNKSSW